MSKTNNLVFKVLYVIAWIIFIGLCIEAGALIVNFFYSLYRPDIVQNLYQNLDLSEILKHNQSAFFGIYSFILSISILKAYLFYIVIRLIHKMDLAKPFSHFVAKQISKISHLTIFIGFISYIAERWAEKVTNHNFVIENLNQFWGNGKNIILIGAVIYIIAAIFNKGVEIQTENDLTV